MNNDSPFIYPNTTGISFSFVLASPPADDASDGLPDRLREWDVQRHDREHADTVATARGRARPGAVPREGLRRCVRLCVPLRRSSTASIHALNVHTLFLLRHARREQEQTLLSFLIYLCRSSLFVMASLCYITTLYMPS